VLFVSKECATLKSNRRESLSKYVLSGSPVWWKERLVEVAVLEKCFPSTMRKNKRMDLLSY